MDNQETKRTSQKKIIIIAIVLIALAAIGGIIFYFATSDTSDKNAGTTKETSSTKESATGKNENATPAAATSNDDKDNNKNDRKNIEDMPEPTLDPTVADTTVLETDPEPEVTRKQNQKTFNDRMESKDYAGAKEILDNYFSTSKYAISGGETFFNYAYYYEKQGLYEDSIRYQLDFLEQNIGLNDIVADNTRYQHLNEVLQYVTIDDERIQKIQESVKRWKYIESLLEENKIDTCISEIQSYIKDGIDGVYSFFYIGEAYSRKPDYLSQAKTYYIYLSKMMAKEPNLLESSYSVLFQGRLVNMSDDGRITPENRNFIEDNISADDIP